MMYLVVRDAQGTFTGAAGPNDGNYRPIVPDGCTVSIENAMPDLATPDRDGFTAWIKANMTFALRNSIAKAYPNFRDDCRTGNWEDFQAGCLAANAAIPLTADQWTAFKNAIATYKIPVILP